MSEIKKMSAHEFQERVKVGDLVWFVLSSCRKPDPPIGPCEILLVGVDPQYPQLSAVLEYKFPDGSKRIITPVDATRSSHGAFYSEAEAQKYYDEQIAEFNANPEWQKLHEETEGWMWILSGPHKDDQKTVRP